MDDIKSRIKGMIYGHCLGDAVGLITEFKFKKQITALEFPYKEPIRGFQPCDWTDDTDHLILVMQTLNENNLTLDTKLFAQKLTRWVATGFEELGDTVGMGLGGVINMVIKHEKFLDQPSHAALQIWLDSGKKLAPNGGLMRTSILSALSDLNIVLDSAAQLCKVTHADPRCVASSTLLNYILWMLIHMPDENIDKVLVDAIKSSKTYIDEESNINTSGPTPIYIDPRFKSREDEFAWWVKTGYIKEISALKLDELGKIGFVLKCLSAALYALHVVKFAKENNKTPSFKKTITKIAMEGGDADTNCAVAGAILGAYIGYESLPIDWLNALPNKSWLDNQVDDFLSKLYSSDTYSL